jgi:hypothetical protein
MTMEYTNANQERPQGRRRSAFEVRRNVYLAKNIGRTEPLRSLGDHIFKVAAGNSGRWSP